MGDGRWAYALAREPLATLVWFARRRTACRLRIYIWRTGYTRTAFVIRVNTFIFSGPWRRRIGVRWPRGRRRTPTIPPPPVINTQFRARTCAVKRQGQRC